MFATIAENDFALAELEGNDDGAARVHFPDGRRLRPFLGRRAGESGEFVDAQLPGERVVRVRGQAPDRVVDQGLLSGGQLGV